MRSIEPGSPLREMETNVLASLVAREGNLNAWGVLYERIQPLLERFGSTLGFSAADNEDLVQDALLRAWERRGLYREGEEYERWLYVIFHRLGKDLRRRRSSRSRLLTEAVGKGALAESLTREQPGPWEDLATLEARRKVSLLLARLAPEDQEILVSWSEGAAPSEIAQERGIHPPTLRSRLHRAKQKLREAHGELLGPIEQD